MTLTTEWLKERLKNPRTGTESELISEMLRYREAAENPSCWEIAGQLFTTKEDALKPGYIGTPEPLYDGPVLTDDREAQPVGYIDPDSLKKYRGQRAGGTWSAVQRTTSGLNMTVPIYLTAPPAPAVPPEASPDDIPQEHNINTYSGITWAAAWNACRAAMLAGSQGGDL